jgi:hypothetical protein
MGSVGFAGEALEEGQGEARGLAGAGLGGAQKVFPGEDDGDGLRLDGGGRGVALVRDSAEQLGAQAEGFERRSNGFLLHSAWEGSLPFDRFRLMRF